jgi:hypothetical protein
MVPQESKLPSLIGLGIGGVVAIASLSTPIIFANLEPTPSPQPPKLSTSKSYPQELHWQ